MNKFSITFKWLLVVCAALVLYLLVGLLQSYAVYQISSKVNLSHIKFKKSTVNLICQTKKVILYA